MVGLLNPFRLAVLKLHWTEPAWTSPLNYGDKSGGKFVCALCGSALFDGSHKFESGSGWPSFWRTANDGCVELTPASKDFLGRTECHCAKCNGHLGHVFPDGPIKYGLVGPGESLPESDYKCTDATSLPRYCVNGLALRYKKDE